MAPHRGRRGRDSDEGDGDRRARRSSGWRRAASTTRSAAASRATRSTRTGSCPHFEKMLYDNALLARAYLHAWQLTGDELFRRVCEETLDWALREMRGPEGGFYSALDADSEGEEGKFYVWTEEELRDLLGDDADAAARATGASTAGRTSRARSILYVAGDEIDPELLARARQKLYEVRAQRVWPGLDDKRLTAWNALMIAALADAGAVLERADYLEAARSCADFLLEHDARRRRPPAAHLQGRPRVAERLPRGPRVPGRGAARALRGDVRDALVHRGARARRRRSIERFARPGGGGFFDTASDHEALVVRPRSFEDHPIPSGQLVRGLRAAAARGVHRRARYERRARRGVPAPPPGRRAPPAGVRPPAPGDALPLRPAARGGARRRAAGRARGASCAARVPARTVVLAGMRAGGRGGASRRSRCCAAASRSTAAPAAYVCENFTCRMPVTEPAELERELARAELRRLAAALDRSTARRASGRPVVCPSRSRTPDDPAAERLAQREAGRGSRGRSSPRASRCRPARRPRPAPRPSARPTPLPRSAAGDVQAHLGDAAVRVHASRPALSAAHATTRAVAARHQPAFAPGGSRSHSSHDGGRSLERRLARSRCPRRRPRAPPASRPPRIALDRRVHARIVAGPARPACHWPAGQIDCRWRPTGSAGTSPSPTRRAGCGSPPTPGA